MSADSPTLSVGSLLREAGGALGLDLTLVAGAGGLERRITIPYIQKTGLALAGFDEYLRVGRVLIFGESEVRYLERLAPDAQADTMRRAFDRGIPCILITAGLTLPFVVAQEADAAGVPILSTALTTPTAMAKLTVLLEDRLARRELVHGVLIDVLGLGVLMMGESGIGKSECALDLVVRGHRLVADDAVEVRRRAETVLIGTCPEVTRHHMELRGLGLINVRDLFGVASTRSSKRIELVVQFERWEPGREYERLGLDDDYYEILRLRIPQLRIPVAPGRNLAILVEVAARNQLLKARGRHPARELVERIEQRLHRVDPLEDDDEDEGDLS